MRILRIALLSAVAIYLIACQTTSPSFPAMTDTERQEIEKVCGQELKKCPEFERWLGRVEKLKRQLEN